MSHPGFVRNHIQIDEARQDEGDKEGGESDFIFEKQKQPHKISNAASRSLILSLEPAEDAETKDLKTSSSKDRFSLCSPRALRETRFSGCVL